jgi:PIF1-like helicase/HRDC domain/Helix-turn-helix domain
MKLQTNPQLELAANYVRGTNKNVFLTGKAGTGKTTFLHQLKKDSLKRMAIVAPTGVAAINAGGVTIHSFFQLPFGAWIPGVQQQQRNFTSEKLKVIRALDLLVIDEISMVRADLLDAIDEVLRKYKDRTKPFGGVQLLMIGDLHQLPPIVKDEEWAMLQPHYTTAYFFGSRALQQSNPVAIELKHIYRQADETFIGLLNKVRDNKIDAQVLDLLNSRYQPNFEPTEAEPYITLSSHNASAQAINTTKLGKLTTDLHTFKAVVRGDFPAFSYPTEEVLEFKVGAQVMFVKNDSPEKRYYNGKIGKITSIKEGTIYVTCPGSVMPIAVGAVDWTNIKYTLNDGTKEMDADEIGSFTQVPLKLAWAITIHKSQGLTFERAIIDANAAFAHGQVYVALSRCKTFEGIVLKTKIATSSIRTDGVVRNYSEDMDRNPPTEQDLQRSKMEFQRSLVRELFDCKTISAAFSKANQTILGNDHTINKSAVEAFKNCYIQCENEIIAVAEKFVPQMEFYLFEETLPETNATLQARLQKAGVYFEEKLYKNLWQALCKIIIETDNKSLSEDAHKEMDALKKAVFIKNATFVAAQKAFTSDSYLRAKADADLDYAKAAQAAAPSKSAIADATSPHPVLLNRLKSWREQTATEKNCELYMVISTPTLTELVDKMPTNSKELGVIKGLGVVKIRQFGEEITDIIQQYCQEYNVPKTQFSLLDATPTEKGKLANLPKTDTKRASFDMFKAGKTVAEIAAERGFVSGTIEGHLVHFVGTGDLSITEIMPLEKVDKIVAFFTENPDKSSADAMLHFQNQYSYMDFRAVREHLKQP